MLPDLNKYYVAYVSYRDVGLSKLRRYFLGDIDKILLGFKGIGFQSVVLETCNRVEVYTYAVNPIDVFKWLGLNEEFVSTARVLRGLDVFRHLVHVVSGLDSLAVGEPQIMGQVRKAFNRAKELGCVGSELDFLFSEAFRIGRRVRSRIEFKVFDYAYATLDIIGGGIEGKKVLVVGTGKMARDILGVLVKRFGHECDIWVAGRSKLDYIRSRYGVNTFHLSGLDDYIGDFDIIITCVSVEKPIIVDRHRDLMKHDVILVDLGIPPNVDLGKETSITVYSFEDVSRLISDKYRGISDKVKLLYEYVEIELDRLRDRFRHRLVNEAIRQIYLRAEEIRRAELEEAYRELVKLVGDEETRRRLINLLDVFSWSLVKRIYHQHIEVFRRLSGDSKLDRDLLLLLLSSLGGVNKG